MERVSPSPTPIQLTLPLPDLPLASSESPPADVIRPDQVWTTLTPHQRDQLGQRLTALLQEVFHAADRA